MLLRLLLLLCLCSWVWADEGDKFRIVTLDIAVQDRFERPYVVGDNTTKIGVRLPADDNQNNFDVKNYESLSWAGIEYPRNSQEYLKFPVQNGVAKVQFVVLNDSNAPVDYELVLFDDKNAVHELRPSKWAVGAESSSGEVKAEDLRAPHSVGELIGICLFGLFGLAFSYWLLGRVLFGRMLRNRNMEVGVALGWSNFSLVLAWAMVGLSVSVMFFFPYILWQKMFWIYVLVPAAYFLVVGVVYGMGHLLTRA